jgi:hypothetical protein
LEFIQTWHCASGPACQPVSPPDIVCPDPLVSRCRRPALWSWPTGQPPPPLLFGRPHGTAVPHRPRQRPPASSRCRLSAIHPPLCPSLSTLTCRVAPPRRPSPTSACRVSNDRRHHRAPLFFSPFLSSSLVTRSHPTPHPLHLLSDVGDQSTTGDGKFGVVGAALPTPR